MSELNAMFSNVIESNNKSSLDQDEYPIIGVSSSISRVRNQIEFSKKIKFPIFISGEIGTEKYSVARQIHSRRGLDKSSFIHIPSNVHDLSIYKQYVEKNILNFKGGTLLLSEVDLLSDGLKDYLIGLFMKDEFNKRIFNNDINLIISCTNELISNHNNPQFIAKVFGCSVSHLEIHVPSLRERKEDLYAHVGYILQNVPVKHRLSLADDAMDLLLSYDWPENLDQLQRVLYLLASYCDGKITQEDILALNLIKKPKEEPDPIAWILSLDMEKFKYFHPGLIKALTYIGNNFREEISLDTLSNVACTSNSHLSFLFRNHLRLSFKSVLVQVRVRYAKKLIETSPQVRITDISLQSGFGDLSHFEKMFKRYVGCAPKQYRKKSIEKLEFI